MLTYNEIKPRKFIELEGEPYEVLSSHVFRKQQRKPVNQTKLRNLLTDKVTEYSFHQSEKVEEADLETKEAKFLYQKRDELWFSDPSDPSDRYQLAADVVGDAISYIRPNDTVSTLVYRDEIIGLKVPIKVHLKVTQAPPNIKGNTSSGGTKPVTLETGATVNTPLFIEVGDTVEVNTETGEYVTRVEKR
jgi:elongation factor P